MGAPKDNTAKQAAADEAARQAKITATTQQINDVFNSPARQTQISDFLNAIRSFYTEGLNRDNAIAQRQTKFALARNGQAGSSVAVDQGRHLGEAFQRGLLEAERNAQGRAADVRSQDQSSRLNLIAMAQSGLDATNGVGQAAESLKNNLEAGRSTAKASDLGDIFGSFADLYKKSQSAKEYARGAKYELGTLYQPIGGR